MRTYRFLVVDSDNQAEQPREVFISMPERDDLTHEMTGELLSAVGSSIQRWYVDRHGFTNPTTRCGGPVDPGQVGPE